MAIKDDMEDVQEAVINELITENGITNTLADGQVTETKIANGAVTAAKLGSDVDLTVADGSITPAKLDRDYLESTGGSVSGNLLVGKSVQSIGTVGVTVVSGQVTATADGADAIRLNRKTSDGSIVDLRKDGATVGSISSRSGATLSFVGNPSSGNGAGVAAATNMIIPSNETGAAQDDRISLGSTSTRWKDLYLSGTIKLSNSSTPSTPSGGGVLYVQNGALYFRGSSGTITQLASA